MELEVVPEPEIVGPVVEIEIVVEIECDTVGVAESGEIVEVEVEVVTRGKGETVMVRTG